MRFTPTEIPDVVLVEPDVFRDERGFFLETFQEKRYAQAGITGPFVQDNHAKSTRNVLRGLHAQVCRPQGKLIRVIEGEVFDVAVDIRPESATFSRWVGRRISAKKLEELWVPPGFAHGYCVLSESAQIEYKCTDYYDPEDEIVLLWNDPAIAIEWPLTDPLLSDKDRTAPTLKEQMEKLQSVG